MSDATEPADTAPQPGYAAAMAELESILAQLEDDRLDIDALADHVARAADLVALCRDRLDAAKMRVTEIVASIDDNDAHDPRS
jgi:exodeoxyribonuclease VII small subunit